MPALDTWFLACVSPTVILFPINNFDSTFIGHVLPEAVSRMEAQCVPSKRVISLIRRDQTQSDDSAKANLWGPNWGWHLEIDVHLYGLFAEI